MFSRPFLIATPGEEPTTFYHAGHVIIHVVQIPRAPQHCSTEDMDVYKAEGNETDEGGAVNAEPQGTPDGRLGVDDTAASQIGHPERSPAEIPAETPPSPHDHEDEDIDIDKKRDTDPQGTLIERMGNAKLEDGRPKFGTKRLASEELSESLHVKRMKTEADEDPEQEVQQHGLPLRIPFPDKVFIFA